MATTKTRKSSKGKSPEQIYKLVTDRIVEALENGTVPWQRPWRSAGRLVLHSNLSSKKEYRGINQWLLDLAAITGDYEAPYWVTYKQAKALGGQVRKGEKSTTVVFWKRIKITVEEDGEETTKMIPLLKYYNVFNVEQCDGVEYPSPEPIEENGFNPIRDAQKVIDKMPQRPTLRHRGDSAHYIPAMDLVELPKQEQFNTPEQYYNIAYHELTHSTGHESRTGRIKDWTGFGSDPYAKEELVAQMSAAMLSSVVGIDIQTVQEQDAAYIQSWIQRFKNDPKLLVHASSQAQRAADFILGRKYEEESNGNGGHNDH